MPFKPIGINLSLIFLTLCIAGVIPLHAQTSQYGIFFAGKQVGEINASLNRMGEGSKYDVKSSASFKIMWKMYRSNSNMSVFYRSDTLESSISWIKKNGTVEELSKVKRDSDYYICHRHKDGPFKAAPDVTFSTAKLYFHEPTGVKEVYSETYLTKSKLEDQGGHKYKLTLKDGHVNYYTYSEGELIEVFVDRPWFNITFKKRM